MRSPLLRLFIAVASLVMITGSPARADVVINEIVSAASKRLLQWDADGTPRVGTGTRWQDVEFDDATWSSGPQPFGHGTVSGAPAVGTNLATQMQYLTPTLYLRKAFTVSAADAGRPDQLQLTIDFNDGFICYVNGVEVARRWAGPPKQFHYHDQPAYNPVINGSATSGFYSTGTLNLGAANTLLREGANVIAVHALNLSRNNTTFLARATLTVSGGPALVNGTDTWKYLPGVVEPSGTHYDPSLIFTNKLKVPWGAPTGFDDTEWGAGPGPIGAGTPTAAVGTNVSGVIGQTPSLYLRAVFNVTAAQAASNTALQLLADYDDAFVAYLNGVEVARANIGNVSGGVLIPHTFTPANAVANSTRNNTGSQTTYTLDPPSRLLKEGLNVLAIQLHNVSINDPDLYTRADLRIAGGAFLVLNNQQWRYFAGTSEPIPTDDTGTEDSPEELDYANDWIELHNNGAAGVSLAGWRLTDAANNANKWFFPAGVSIPAGGYLVVFCDGENIDQRAAGGYLHTNFKLAAGGEYLALRDANGALVQDFSPSIPRGSPFHSYGRKADGTYVYFDTATPGAANAGTELAGFVAEPVFGGATGGFYTSAQLVTLSCPTPGAAIRYTLNGSEPTETTGTLYTGAFAPSNVAVRARAFKAGMIPSRSSTSTYLINQTAARRSLPAMVITADPDRSLYRRYGIFAITNNIIADNYSGGIWHAQGDPGQYNNANLRGFFSERPGHLQFMQKAGSADPSPAGGFSTDFGMRCAGSPYSRPRYVFSWLNNLDPNSASPFASSATQKPQINAFFRDDYGVEPLEYPLFPGSPVTTFDNLRMRSGKNDISNPFIRDELTRRLFIDMGNACARGIMATLWINGVYKGYYNPVERPRESFFQRAFNSDKSWDVWVINDAASGDNLMLQELITFVRNNSPSVYANYAGAATRMDMTNFVDYLILNVYEAMGDWPHNNYVMARERSSTGKWTFTVWDGEGSFGSFNTNVRFNNFAPVTNSSGTSGAIVASDPQNGGVDRSIRILYTLLRSSAEFRLLFADRLQKHFFTPAGALTDANIFARKNALKTELSQLFSMTDAPINNWVNGQGSSVNGSGTAIRFTTSDGTAGGSVINNPSRRQVLFNGYYDDTAGGAFIPPRLVAEGLFPATQAPAFSQYGGNVAQGFQLTITNPNGTGAIYYTTDGSDPRGVGGTVQGLPYSVPVTINQSTLVKARVRNANNEWSPTTEATFAVAQLPQILVTEIMYHPLGQGGVSADDFEFIEIKNTGASTVNLNGWQFAGGVEFTFPPRASLPPGAFAVVARNDARFTSRYPGVSRAGVYGGQLDNGGETIELRDLAGALVTAVTYSDTAPWPALADGYGNSLVPVNPNSNPAPNNPANWRSSAGVHGSPGADDPPPPTVIVYINELLANSLPGQSDAVELFNPGPQAVDIGGWFLSDNTSNPKKYRIPDGTVIDGLGYLTFSESHFNPGGTGFAFDANGEEARLSAADAAGTLTGYSHGFSFDASAPGVSFGRHVNSIGVESFPAQKAQSFGAENAGPRIGPVVISEIMYRPAAGGDEFIELRNVSQTAVPLFDPARPANTWRMAGVGYSLPTGITLQPAQVILLTPLSEAAWRSKYATHPAIEIYGPYPGNLGDSGERVSLQMPGVPYVNGSGQNVVPMIDIDSVNYGIAAPWPASPAGTGPSLERWKLRAHADDPANWRASPLAGGSAGIPARMSFTTWRDASFTPLQLADSAISDSFADPDGDGIPNFREYAHGTDPFARDAIQPVTIKLALDDAAGPFLTLQFRRSLAAENVSFGVDTAGALTAWILGGAQQIGTPVNNGDGTETLTFRDTDPSAGPGAPVTRFMRLRVFGN